MKTRQEKIDLLEGIRESKINPGDLIDPKYYLLHRGKINFFHSEPTPNPELTLEQFCKVFRPKRDTLGLGYSGIPPKGTKSDPSGITMKKIIEHFLELDIPESREYIYYCNNLEQLGIERYGEVNYYAYQAKHENTEREN